MLRGSASAQLGLAPGRQLAVELRSSVRRRRAPDLRPLGDPGGDQVVAADLEPHAAELTDPPPRGVLRVRAPRRARPPRPGGRARRASSSLGAGAGERGRELAAPATHRALVRR